MLDAVRWITRSGEICTDYRPGLAREGGTLRLLDQTLLPEDVCYVELNQTEAIFDAIRRLVVRGAPAIGCAAALGVAAVLNAAGKPDLKLAEATAARLAESRPTAVNLFWALDRTIRYLHDHPGTDIREAALEAALAILTEDIAMCRAIGTHAQTLIPAQCGILTHCNAGALATADYGTALAPVYVAQEAGKQVTVYSDETRPLLQGSRLTAWELTRAGVPVVTICDNMAAQVMRENTVPLVIVGADRSAANGDTAPKIGTYGVAILARYHRIPFYVAAPYSTFDLTLASGAEIPIEQRGGDEIRCGMGKWTAPRDVAVYNPAFDVTPAELIAGFITERGILLPPFR